jgi:hypothetical protein
VKRRKTKALTYAKALRAQRKKGGHELALRLKTKGKKIWDLRMMIVD